MGGGGRSLSLGRDEGVTKVLFDEATDRHHRLRDRRPERRATSSPRPRWRSRLGADGADIALTIHPHPTLSETVAMAAEAFEGTLTDLYLPKKKKWPTSEAGAMSRGTPYELIQNADGVTARIHGPRAARCWPRRRSTGAPRSPQERAALGLAGCCPPG